MAFRKLRRYKQAADPETCREVLEGAKRGVLSVIGDDGWPYGVPVNYYYEPDEDTIYIHGAGEGHKIDALTAGNDSAADAGRASFTVWREDYRDDGDWAWHLTSVIAFGRASLVEDRDFVREKVGKLAYKYFPDAGEADAALQKDSVNRVALIALHVEHMSGKRVYEK